MKKNFLYLFLSALLLGNAVLGYRLYSKETPKDTQQVMEKMELFMNVFQQLRSHYVDKEEVQIDALFDNAIRGMVFSLDPFSEYMTPKEFQAFEEQGNDTFGGIGVQVHMVDGLLTVSSTLKNTPAAAAGILAGDQIIAIDGENQAGKDMDEIIRKLRGEPGTSVELTIQRMEEDAPLQITLERAKIENTSVTDIHVVPGTHTGFLRIEQFVSPTARQFEEAVRELLEQDIDSLVIDLRDNPGGQVAVCVDILSMLLPEDSVVATLEGRTPELNNVYKTHAVANRLPDNIPVAVLGNRGSASAAEIAISCLRDYHRAVFIGERTFGKALVQDVTDLGGGHAVKFTVAKYYTKLHTPIQGRGIRPDIEQRLTRKDFMTIYNPKDGQNVDELDPNLQTALKFFAEGAQWPVYEGKPEGDYPDLLPQWQRDEDRRYKLYDYNIYGDLQEEENAVQKDSGDAQDASPEKQEK